MIKSAGRTLLTAILSWQVRRLRAKHSFRIIGIVGSYGKTSTKFAVASLLGTRYRVHFQSGNYNHLLTVPLVFFDRTLPGLFNIPAWLRLLIHNERALRRPYPYDIVVVELGTDGPGQIAQFSAYLHLDLAIVTAIGEEHMEFFPDVQAVADEELSVQRFSRRILYNADLCDPRYVHHLDNSASFGTQPSATYHIDNIQFTAGNFSFELQYDKTTLLSAAAPGIAKTQVYCAAAAAVTGLNQGMSADEIADGLTKPVGVNGRMQLLDGIHGSTIIDETYNASPASTKAALDTLYSMPAPQKIALLGNMNELGSYSRAAHEEIGTYCDPAQLDLVLTLGPHANTYLAPAASAKGCSIQTFDTPYAAGTFLRDHLKEGAVVLVKGSQNGVYAEEAIKAILANPADSNRLVRQSSAWLRKKARNFQTN
jgi:UDP-N-acetylmuramoyl-tripeptide--D-alanyl-D-alanine ligase